MTTITLHNDRIVVKTPFQLKELCKSVLGARWDKEQKAWTYPATPTAAGRVLEAFASYQPKVSREVIELENVSAQIDIIKVASNHLEPIPDTKFQPWKHQHQGYHLIKSLPGCMLAFDMGTGKTKTVVDTVANSDYQRVLIVCPKSVIPVWPKEFIKHTFKKIKVLPLNENSVQKRVNLMDKTFRFCQTPVVVVINYEAVWQNSMGEYISKCVDWDMIVCDESHRIKSPKGVASKFLAKLKAKKKVCLTGTPMPHSPLDVWAQYRFLDPSIYGNSFTAFRARYAVMGGFHNHQVLGFQNQEELHNRFYSIALRVTKSDVLDLPDTIDEERSIKLNSKSMTTYQQMEDDFVAEIENNVVTASNALSKLLRLQQITSGFVSTEDNGEISVGQEKADELVELFDDIPQDQPVVVFCRFRHDLKMVAVAADAAKRKHFELSGKVNELHDWQQDDSGSVIAVQIQAGGAGVDLTRASYCIYYSLTFSLGDYEQSRARLHRPGQKNNVTYIHLLAENTIDQKIFEALQKRKDVVESVLEMFSKKQPTVCV